MLKKVHSGTFFNRCTLSLSRGFFILSVWSPRGLPGEDSREFATAMQNFCPWDLHAERVIDKAPMPMNNFFPEDSKVLGNIKIMG